MEIEDNELDIVYKQNRNTTMFNFIKVVERAPKKRVKNGKIVKLESRNTYKNTLTGKRYYRVKDVFQDAFNQTPQIPTNKVQNIIVKHDKKGRKMYYEKNFVSGKMKPVNKVYGSQKRMKNEKKLRHINTINLANMKATEEKRPDKYIKYLDDTRISKRERVIDLRKKGARLRRKLKKKERELQTKKYDPITRRKKEAEIRKIKNEIHKYSVEIRGPDESYFRGKILGLLKEIGSD